MIYIATTLLAIALTGPSNGPLAATREPPKSASIVDYLKSLGEKSEFADRKALFAETWPDEGFRGTAEQNTRLLKALLKKRNHALLPFPSDKINGCEAFYTNAAVAQYMTRAFEKNAVHACVVTGTSVANKTIRSKLQEQYIRAKPGNGKTFTPEEHKKIHDLAYQAAGCKEKESAAIWGWYVVNTASLPTPVIKFAIKTFGSCTISGEKLGGDAGQAERERTRRAKTQMATRQPNAPLQRAMP